jgi:hypothetical protein
MNDGSGPLSYPIRITAGVLGVYLAFGGLLLASAALSMRFWSAILEGVAGLFLGFLFVRAAWTGWSPAWPD